MRLYETYLGSKKRPLGDLFESKKRLHPKKCFLQIVYNKTANLVYADAILKNI